MAMCSLCLKTNDIGHLVSHAKNRVRTVRRPNLHRKMVFVGKTKKKILICTSCLRSLKRATKLGEAALASPSLVV